MQEWTGEPYQLMCNCMNLQLELVIPILIIFIVVVGLHGLYKTLKKKE